MTPGGLTPSESKKGILKPKVEAEPKQRSKRNIRFEDEPQNTRDGDFNRLSPAGTQEGFGTDFGLQNEKNSNGSSETNPPTMQGNEGLLEA